MKIVLTEAEAGLIKKALQMAREQAKHCPEAVFGDEDGDYCSPIWDEIASKLAKSPASNSFPSQGEE